VRVDRLLARPDPAGRPGANSATPVRLLHSDRAPSAEDFLARPPTDPAWLDRIILRCRAATLRPRQPRGCRNDSRAMEDPSGGRSLSCIDPSLARRTAGGHQARDQRTMDDFPPRTRRWGLARGRRASRAESAADLGWRRRSGAPGQWSLLGESPGLAVDRLAHRRAARRAHANAGASLRQA
jgi:hypothetical protein